MHSVGEEKAMKIQADADFDQKLGDYIDGEVSSSSWFHPFKLESNLKVKFIILWGLRESGSHALKYYIYFFWLEFRTKTEPEPTLESPTPDDWGTGTLYR